MDDIDLEAEPPVTPESCSTSAIKEQRQLPGSNTTSLSRT